MLAVLLSWSPPVHAVSNGLARTPPMGWNSWNQVRCYDLTEQVVRDAADALASTGMREAGYHYVVIDDCWQAPTRAADGSLRPDPVRFPGGIAALAEYVHDRGLLFGIYAVPGSRTCAMANDGYPATGIGSLGHERQDAGTFEDWDVDYLKYDWCNADTVDGLQPQAAFAKMRDELARLDRPIMYAISEYGLSRPWTWARPVANLWRTTFDLQPEWTSVRGVIDQQAAVAESSGLPGGWNDPDMLQIGNGTLTDAENRAHFSMWAILNAPLFAGTDPAKLGAGDLETLTNTEAIAVDRDFAVAQGRRLAVSGAGEVWGKPLSDGGFALVLLNTGNTLTSISASIPGIWAVRDLWLHKDVGTADGTVSATVAPHSATMLRLTDR
ncbi:glycoside hydrolase family 27 protein [Amycolatopsis sp. H20-H5]|uniref:glycoside hydrolase family 27 protein n=1 Tax=Amycolatopsis sp. H20-H5 TaxID=3046309 RepID=UPI002DBF8451|nr:glycoside hydrolase family 27 protein [Amycolatopsis sp. H20-H5]MEC3973748.1 glycoside hydrolase family 27 protein [Amycolatopsis sp. H20-H5]